MCCLNFTEKCTDITYATPDYDFKLLRQVFCSLKLFCELHAGIVGGCFKEGAVGRCFKGRCSWGLSQRRVHLEVV